VHWAKPDLVAGIEFGTWTEDRVIRQSSLKEVRKRSCRHSNLRYPVDLKRYQDPKWAWTLMIPRFKCSVCGERDAFAEAQPLPR